MGSWRTCVRLDEERGGRRRGSDLQESSDGWEESRPRECERMTALTFSICYSYLQHNVLLSWWSGSWIAMKMEGLATGNYWVAGHEAGMQL